MPGTVIAHYEEILQSNPIQSQGINIENIVKIC